MHRCCAFPFALAGLFLLHGDQLGNVWDFSQNQANVRAKILTGKIALKISYKLRQQTFLSLTFTIC